MRNLIYTILYANSIKNGSFITETVESLKDAEQSAIEIYNTKVSVQNMLINAPENTYFMNGLQFIALAAVYVLLTMFMVRRWLEDDKLNSSFIAAGATLAFEIARSIPEWLFSSGKISEQSEYVILEVLYAVTVAVCVFLFIKVMKDYPHGREKFIKPMRMRAEEAEQKQRRRTWNAINEYNEKAEGEDFSEEDGERAAEEEASGEDSENNTEA